MPIPLAVGDQVTVRTTLTDPVELFHHSHAVITAVTDEGYIVGHPPAQRRYGPYPESRFIRGWGIPGWRK